MILDLVRTKLHLPIISVNSLEKHFLSVLDELGEEMENKDSKKGDKHMFIMKLRHIS